MPEFITELLQLIEAFPVPNKLLLGIIIVSSGVAASYASLRYLFSAEKIDVESHKILLEPESTPTFTSQDNPFSSMPLQESPQESYEDTAIKDSWRPDSRDQWKERRSFLYKNQAKLLKTYIPIIIISKDKIEYLYKSKFPFSSHWLNLWRAGFYTAELQIILLSMLRRLKPMGFEEDISFIINYRPREKEFEQLRFIFHPEPETVKNTVLSIETQRLPRQLLFSKLLEVKGLIFSRDWYNNWKRRLGNHLICNPAITKKIFEKSSLPLKFQLAQEGHLSDNLSWRDFIRRQIFYHGNYKRASFLNLEKEPGLGLLTQDPGKLNYEMIKHADVLFKNQVFEKIHKFKLRAIHVPSLFNKNEIQFQINEITFYQEQFYKMPARIKQSWMLILRDHNEHSFLLENINQFPRGIRRTVILRYEAERLYREKKYSEALSKLKRALSYDIGNVHLLKAGFLYSFYDRWSQL